MQTERDVPRIVVGVDGSQSSVAALQEALDLAEDIGATVLAVTVWDVPSIVGSTDDGGVSGSATDARMIQAGVLRKAICASASGGQGSGAQTLVLRGDPRVILVQASLTALMLVVGRRGYGSLYGLPTGSVSSACVAYAHCPVLVVHNSKTRENVSTREGQ